MDGTTPRARGPRALSHWSIDHPWMALVSWLVLVASAVTLGIGAGTVMQDPQTSGVGDSGAGDRAVAAAPMGPPTTAETAIVTRRDGGALDPRQIDEIATGLRRELRAAPGVREVGPHLISTDGAALTMPFELDDTDDRAVQAVAGTRAALARVAADVPGTVAQQAGMAAFTADLDATLSADFSAAERLSIPITFLILLVVFGAVVAALVPLLLAITAIAAAFGLTAALSHAIAQSDALATMLLLVGVAVGVDYALFLTRRFSVEHVAGATRRAAARRAVDTSGHAVVVSGLTVMVSMAAMTLSREATFTGMGIASMVVVACAVAGAILAVPALLVLLGHRLDRLPVPFLRRLRRRDGGASRLWGGVAQQVTRRPVAALAASAGVLVALAAPAVGMRLKMPGFADLPRTTMPSMRAHDALQRAFPQEGSSHTVVIVPRDGRTVRDPTVTAAVDAFVDAARGSGLFIEGFDASLTRSRDGRVATLDLPYRGDENGADATRSLTALRERLVPATIGPVADAHVTGFAAGSRDFTDLVRTRLPMMMAFVVVVTFIVMLLSFGSVWLAAATVALNSLSVAAAYGLLVIVFQRHWFDGLLGVTTNGGVVTWLPMFLFVILFGLSMDYHVFVISRVQEAVRAGLAPRNAITHGVAHSGPVVSSAAVVMVAAFGIFATLSTIDMKQLGVGLAAAIAIDATLVRGVLLPATLATLGARAWDPHPWVARLVRPRRRTVPAAEG